MRGLAAAVLLAIFWRQYVELRTERLGALQALMSVVAGVGVFGMWIALDNGEGAGFRPLTAEGTLDWPILVARFAILAAVVPVMEELFWRSFLMRWIDARDFLGVDARKASRTAILVTSGVFALEHSLWLAGLIAGLAYAGLYMTTNNLRAPVLAHAVTNGILGLWIVATGSWHLW